MENENLNPAEETEQIPEKQQEEPETETPEETPAEPEEEKTEAEESEETEEEEVEEEESIPSPRRRVPRGALIFLATAMGLLLCGLILLICVMFPLSRVLEQYESVQPEYVAQEVYDTLFADPDWELLYDLAGVKNTAFEGKEAFVSYMEDKTAGQELICRQDSTGLSGDLRYTLSANGEILAAYTLKETEGSTLYANWVLDGVEVYFTREKSVTVVTSPDCTVYINGVALDDSYLVLYTDTVAEKHLPDGVHGYRSQELYMDGLLWTPEVVVLDEEYNQLPVYYSAATDTYSTEIPTSPEITEDEIAIVLEAAQTQALFDVRACNISQLRQHFDPNSQLYADLTDAEPFCDSYKSHVFDEESFTVTDYYRYSDTLFSVRVSLSMDVTDKKKATSTYTLDTTYFFTLHNSGVYLVTGSTDDDLTQSRSFVQLTYVMDGEVLQSKLTNVNTKKFSTPKVSDSITIVAWGRENEDGTLTTVLTLNDKGKFVLADGATLESMTLYPIFGDELE